MHVDKLKYLLSLSSLFFHCIALLFRNKYLIQNKQSVFQAYLKSFWEINFTSLFSFSSFAFWTTTTTTLLWRANKMIMCETLNNLWSVIHRKRNYSGFCKTFFYQCWWLLLFKIYLHRTRELENLFGTLSAQQGHGLVSGRAEPQLLSPPVASWICFLSC